MLSRTYKLTSESIGVLYSQMAEKMLLFLTRRTGNPEVALDLLSETFVEAFAERARFRGKTQAQAMAWIWAIARRQLADYWRSGDIERRAMKRVGVTAPRDMTDEEIERVEQLSGLQDLMTLVRTGMDGLPQEQRDALRLRVVDERPYDQVASLLGISEQAVRARVSRGLRSLAEQLEQDPS